MSAYGQYIERLSRKAKARLDDIEATYNFDLGPEFEVAVCQLLSEILPAKYGVARGFVVAEDGQEAGDDVIVFDRMLYPTLRSSMGDHFAVKEKVPIEAVYAYIECKHTLNHENFLKAVEQVRSVKALVARRRSLLNPSYEAGGPVYNGEPRDDWPRPYPPLRNQMFGVVLGRRWDGLEPAALSGNLTTPDLVVLGEDYVMTQSVLLGADGIKGALFYDSKNGAPLRLERTTGNAFGISLVTLLHAIGWIQLLPIDWSNALSSAFWSALMDKK